MFRYRLHSPDGDDLGEAIYAQMIHADEEIIAGDNQHFRVLDVVPFEEEDESPFVGLLAGRGGVRPFGSRSPSVRRCTMRSCLY
jgi:hypothetical protein